jgi:hypothetical protein
MSNGHPVTIFATLVLGSNTASSVSSYSTAFPASNAPDHSPGNRTVLIGGVVGGVLGGVLAAILLIMFLLGFLRRRKANERRHTRDLGMSFFFSASGNLGLIGFNSERKPQPFPVSPTPPFGEDNDKAPLRRSMQPALAGLPSPGATDSQSDLHGHLMTNTSSSLGNDGGALPSSAGAIPRSPPAVLHIVGADSRDSTDDDGTPVSVVPAGKIAAAARARALAGQAPEASVLQRPAIATIEVHPADMYAGRSRISTRISVSDTAPPMYTEQPV